MKYILKYHNNYVASKSLKMGLPELTEDIDKAAIFLEDEAPKFQASSPVCLTAVESHPSNISSIGRGYLEMHKNGILEIEIGDEVWYLDSHEKEELKQFLKDK